MDALMREGERKTQARKRRESREAGRFRSPAVADSAVLLLLST